jgi:hypothetical protein
VVEKQAEPQESEKTGQLLRFRRRPRLGPPSRNAAASAHPDSDADDDLAQYERDDDDIDYRQRMLMNVIALTIVAALVAVGVWIADTIAGMEKFQDCVLQGRGNCAPIEAPPRRE